MIKSTHLRRCQAYENNAMPSDRCWGQRNHECVKTMVVDRGDDYDYDNDQIKTDLACHDLDTIITRKGDKGDRPSGGETP